MKVHIVTNANRARYASALRDMHAHRHHLFVEELGWSALRSKDGLEIDDYDDRYAVYMLALEQGELRGSARLLPSWRRSLTRDHLSSFVADGEALVGPDIWEWTRWVPGDTRRPKRLVKSRKLLLLAGLEFGLSRGVEAFTAVCDSKIVGQLVEIGWEPRPIGLPTRFSEGTATAITWTISPALLDSTRRTFRMNGPASLEAPSYFGDGAIDPDLVPEIIEGVVSLNSPLVLSAAAMAIRDLVAVSASSPTIGFAGGQS